MQAQDLPPNIPEAPVPVTVRLDIESTFGMIRDMPISTSITLSALKRKLMMRCGCESEEHMKIEVGNKDGIAYTEMLNLEKTLAEYVPDISDGWRLKVTDTNPTSWNANDFSASNNAPVIAPKAKASAGLSEFKKRAAERKAAQRKARAAAIPKNFEEEEAKSLSVGLRVSVGKGSLTYSPEKYGEIAYIGVPAEAQAAGLPNGYWVGVRLDQPTGKNNGCFKGIRVFEAKENCGTFVRPSSITLIETDADEL